MCGRPRWSNEHELDARRSRGDLADQVDAVRQLRIDYDQVGANQLHVRRVRRRDLVADLDHAMAPESERLWEALRGGREQQRYAHRPAPCRRMLPVLLID